MDNFNHLFKKKPALQKGKKLLTSWELGVSHPLHKIVGCLLPRAPIKTISEKDFVSIMGRRLHDTQDGWRLVCAGGERRLPGIPAERCV